MNNMELGEFFLPEFFLPKLVSADKEKVIEELVQPLYDAKKVKSKGIILATLSKRETLGSTGIGKGIAIPHCRTLAVSDVHVVAGISKSGIDFKAIDKKKVHLFFLIVAPPQEKTNIYLPILGKIVELVRETKVRKVLMSVTEFSEFIQIVQGG